MSNQADGNSNHVEVWEKLDEETDEQYDWFVRFYLPLGLRRSLAAAHSIYVAENDPKRFILQKSPQVSPEWKLAFRHYKWEERANAYDNMAYADVFLAVKEAALRIRAAAPMAVDALIAALANPRLAVAAANSILDRSGMQTASVTLTTPMTAEDLAKAEAQLDEWMKQNKESNG